MANNTCRSISVLVPNYCDLIVPIGFGILEVFLVSSACFLWVRSLIPKRVWTLIRGHMQGLRTK